MGLTAIIPVAATAKAPAAMFAFIVRLSVLAVFATLIAAEDDSKTCPDPSEWLGEDLTVEVSGCPTPDKKPCELVKGESANIIMKYKTRADLKEVTANVQGILIGVPFPFLDENACDNMACPAKKGTEVVYNASIPVKGAYPSVDVTVKWQLISEGKTVVCTLIPSKIVRQKRH